MLEICLQVLPKRGLQYYPQCAIARGSDPPDSCAEEVLRFSYFIVLEQHLVTKLNKQESLSNIIEWNLFPNNENPDAFLILNLEDLL